MELLNTVEKWIEILWRAMLILIFIAFLLIVIVSIATIKKRRILFKAWINRFDPGDKDLGTSIGDLLLFNLQSIKNVHDKSSNLLSIWNPYQDIPSIKQSLEKEVELIGSVELGNYGKIINFIAAFLMRVLPFVIKPAMLIGSINKYGEKKSLLMVTLDNYLPRRKPLFLKKIPKNTFVWKIEKEDLTKEQIPDLIEQIAYRIYLDLTGNELFKTWECFRLYTKGLEKYINFTYLARESDYTDAEKLYNKAIELEPNNAVICYNKGVMKYYKYEEQENNDAIGLFKKALNSSDIQLQVRARTGLVNGLVQQYHRFNTKNINALKEAMDHGEEACRFSSRLDSVHKCLGFAYHQYSEALMLKEVNGSVSQLNEYRLKAIQHYEKAYALNTHHYIAHNNLGNLYLEWAKQEDADKLSLLKKAIREFKRSLHINPRYQHAYDNLGNAYALAGKYEEARDAYFNALLYKPDYAEAKNDLAILFLNPGNSEQDKTIADNYHLEAMEMAKTIALKEKLASQYAASAAGLSSTG